MLYRENIRTKDSLSVIGMGIYDIPNIMQILDLALENGINLFDFPMYSEKTYSDVADIIGDKRKNVFYQVQFGMDVTKGRYAWSLELDNVKKSVDIMMKNLRTDYVDYGCIHCIDEESDWETFVRNGVFEFLLSLKRQGVVRHLSLGSHTPKTAEKIIDEIEIEQIMFSTNIAYDYVPELVGGQSRIDRQALYEKCLDKGIGIVAMKAFCGGLLLDENRSPIGRAITPHQCLQYVLDRPGVVSAMLGIRSQKELRDCLGILKSSALQRDYSTVKCSFLDIASIYDKGICIYCNHCAPCPQGIDVGLVNKYYDLSYFGDNMATEHYLTLEKKADDCIACGHCERRCPFHVKQSSRMKDISTYFKKQIAIRRKDVRAQKKYDILRRWMELSHKNISLKEFFEDNSFLSVAIYGAGEIGVLLGEEICKDLDIVKYYLDKNPRECVNDVIPLPVYSLDNEAIFPVDVVIITPVLITDQLETAIWAHFPGQKVFELEEILYYLSVKHGLSLSMWGM